MRAFYIDRLAFGAAAIVVATIGAWAAYQQFAEQFSSQHTSSKQVGKLVAKLATRAECDQFRAKLLAQSEGNPASGATQYAIAIAWADAGKAGCVAN